MLASIGNICSLGMWYLNISGIKQMIVYLQVHIYHKKASIFVLHRWLGEYHDQNPQYQINMMMF